MLRALVLLPVALLVACASGPRSPADAERADVTAALSDGGQRWADALVAYATDSARIRDLPALVVSLRDSSALVRQRAAMAIGALGEPARPAAAALLPLLQDPDSLVRAEAAFAVGRLRHASGAVAEALYRALKREPARAVRVRLNAAFSTFDPRARLPISDAMAASLRQDLTGDAAEVREMALNIAARVDLPGARELVVANIRHPNPDVRMEAAWALAVSADTTGARAEIQALARDTVKWLADEVPWLVGLIGTYRHELPPCGHRAVAGLLPAALSVEDAGGSVAGDGRGAYVQGRDGVRASHSYAFNLLLPWGVTPAVPTVPVPPTASSRPWRALRVDLSAPAPAGGGIGRGVVLDTAATFHTFFMYGRDRLIWNTRDIPVGARVRSSRSEFTLRLDGRMHKLQFGPRALGDCNEGYATAGRVHGEGTTPLVIERVSADEFVVTAPPGSVGRLWDYSAPPAKDLGLYRASFRFRITAAPQP